VKQYRFISIGLTEGDMTTKTISASTGISARVKSGLVCLFTGSAMILMVGLSHISAVHNAAHDTRHAIGFPCH
jgi:cobalt transporter subunit CbtB